MLFSSAPLASLGTPGSLSGGSETGSGGGPVHLCNLSFNSVSNSELMFSCSDEHQMDAMYGTELGTWLRFGPESVSHCKNMLSGRRTALVRCFLQLLE